MKKILCFVLAAAMILSLAACGKTAAPAAETPAPAEPAVKSVPKKAVKAHSVSAASASKVAMNTKVQQVLSKAKYESPAIAYMASLVTKNVGDAKIKQTVYRSTIAQFGQKKGLEIYNLVKPLLK